VEQIVATLLPQIPVGRCCKRETIMLLQEEAQLSSEVERIAAFSR
jgi:hypothetical protein